MSVQNSILEKPANQIINKEKIGSNDTQVYLS